MNSIEQTARDMALEWINDNRHGDGIPPLRCISPAWWNRYGKEWIEKAVGGDGKGTIKCCGG